jgi:hypothetical protein
MFKVMSAGYRRWVNQAADERMLVARWKLTRCIFMTMAAMDQQEYLV